MCPWPQEASTLTHCGQRLCLEGLLPPRGACTFLPGTLSSESRELPSHCAGCVPGRRVLSHLTLATAWDRGVIMMPSNREGFTRERAIPAPRCGSQPLAARARLQPQACSGWLKFKVSSMTVKLSGSLRSLCLWLQAPSNRANQPWPESNCHNIRNPLRPMETLKDASGIRSVSGK